MPIRTTMDHRTSMVLALLTAAFWAAVVLWKHWGLWAPDLSAIWFAARFYADGQPELVYASPARFFGSDYPPEWIALRDVHATATQSVFPFVYPPIWAALIAPIAAITTPWGFFAGTYVLQIAMLAAAPFLSYRIIRPGISLALWVALACAIYWTSSISTLALVHNQPQITVAFLALLAFERNASGKPLTAGTCLALAATIKLSPAILVLVFVMDRNWRALTAFTATGATITAASFAIAGPELHWVFLSKLAIIAEQVAVMRVNWSLEANLYLAQASLTGLHPLFAATEGQGSAPEPLWISLVTKAALVLGLAACWMRSRAMDSQTRLRVLPLAIALIATLCAPLSWAHHYLFCLFLAPALFVLWPLRDGALRLLMVVLATSVPVFNTLAALAPTDHYPMILGTAGIAFLLVSLLTAPAISRRAAPGHGAPMTDNSPDARNITSARAAI